MKRLTLEISGLALTTQIGIYAWEKKIKQKVLIDVTMTWPHDNCHDELNQTVDYAVLCEKITDYVENQTFNLIETLAEQVAQEIKNNFSSQSLIVRVSKPHAVKNASNVAITLTC